MPKELNLKEFTELVAQMNTLDGELEQLISIHEQTQEDYDNTLKEISRLKGLNKKADEIKVQLSSIKNEVDSLRGQRDSIYKQIQTSGWKVPLPERKIVTSAMRI